MTDLGDDEVMDAIDVLAYVGQVSIKAERAHRTLVRMWAELRELRELRAKLKAAEPAPGKVDPRWDRDPAIDWTGIDGGRPSGNHRER